MTKHRIFSIAYTLYNRGRYHDSFIKSLNEILPKYKNKFILVIDECDAVDEKIGLNGRKIYNFLKKQYYDVLEISVPKDKSVGIGYVYTKDIRIEEESWTIINEDNLKLPQGPSEHYPHHRLTTLLKFQNNTQKNNIFDGVFIVAQHNSAFIRPFTRARQSQEAMEIFTEKMFINKKYLGFLIRDQNTILPGEGAYERYLRKKFKIISVTDQIQREYNISRLEDDTGGLNKAAKLLYKYKVWNIINLIIRLGDKIESICVTQEQYRNPKLIHIPDIIEIPDNDHGILITDVYLKL